MRAHVIIGDDDYLVDQLARKQVNDPAALEVIDSRTATNEERQFADLHEVESSYQTPPFLTPTKITWWKNVGFLPGAASKKDDASGAAAKTSEAVKEALQAFATRLAAYPFTEDQTFILTGPRLLKTSVFAKTLAKGAEIVYLPSKGDKASVANHLEWARQEAAEIGLTFAAGAFDCFCAKVGTDARSTKNELEKLSLYLGSPTRPITTADIEAVTSAGIGVEQPVWTISKAVGARRTAEAMKALTVLSKEKGFAIVVSTYLTRFFAQLAAMKEAETSKVGWNEATKGLSPWAVRENQAYLRNWTLLELRAARMRFMRLRTRVLSLSEDGLEALMFIELSRTLERAK